MRTRLRGFGRWSATAVLAGTVATTAVAAGASGAVTPPGIGPDYSLAVAVSPSNGSAKSVTATCPPGMKVIGAGGEVTDTGYAHASGDGDAQVSLTDIVPAADLRSVTVTAGIRDPLNWNFATDTFTVTAQARCARTLVSPVVTGLERVSGSAPDNGTSASHKAATATCTTGKILVGTGFQLDQANGKVFVNRVWPTGVDDGVQVDAYDDLLNATGQVALGDLVAPPVYNGVWDLKAFAICIDKGVSPLTAAGTDLEGGISGSTTQSCPAGRVVTTTFVDVQDEWQAGYSASTAAIEALSLDRNTKKAGPWPVADSSTVRVSIDQTSGWVAFVYPYCR